MVAPQPTDNAYRRLYYYLHKLVDQAIGRILDALDASGMADDTIVVFTSDHGDLLGAHGGMQQKWANAFDEAHPGAHGGQGPRHRRRRPAGISVPTSHVDLIPTLMGLAGIDVEQAAAGVAAAPHRGPAAARPRPQRRAHRSRPPPSRSTTPIYFMTEDDVTSGQSQTQRAHRRAVRARWPRPPASSRSSPRLPTGADGAAELWKLNHYYERLDEWNAEHGMAPDPDRSAPPPSRRGSCTT